MKQMERAVTRRSSWVYAVRNRATGERLIGGAADVERAWRRHQRQLRVGRHTNLALQEAWETQGADAFLVERLEEVSERATLATRVRAWKQQEGDSYNRHWYPRLRPRVITFRDGDRLVQGTVNPPMIIHRIESATELGEQEPWSQGARGRGNGIDAPEHPVIVAYTTYRMPFFERDLPLVVTESGIEYVPVDAWCAELGIRLQTHLWRVRRMSFWEEARELSVTSSASPQTPASSTPSTVPSPPKACSKRRASRSSGRAFVAAALASVTSTAPSWCLPPALFTTFVTGVGWKYVDPALLPALVNLQEQDLARERRQVYERAARVAAYGPMRQRILDILLACEHVEGLLRMVDERLAPRLTVAAGVEIAVLAAQGVTLLAALTEAARSAFAQLRSGGITELTDYDHTVDAMRTRVVPHDPTLPDQVTLSALDACDEALTEWLRRFMAQLRQSLADVDRSW